MTHQVISDKRKVSTQIVEFIFEETLSQIPTVTGISDLEITLGSFDYEFSVMAALISEKEVRLNKEFLISLATEYFNQDFTVDQTVKAMSNHMLFTTLHEFGHFHFTNFVKTEEHHNISCGATAILNLLEVLDLDSGQVPIQSVTSNSRFLIDVRKSVESVIFEEQYADDYAADIMKKSGLSHFQEKVVDSEYYQQYRVNQVEFILDKISKIFYNSSLDVTTLTKKIVRVLF